MEFQITLTDENKFKIDFFELAFLAEACIPPNPIARACFWDRLINVFYELMSGRERAQLYKWILRCPKFNFDNKDCAWFEARFNPENQYIVTYSSERKTGKVECFLKDGKYWTKKDTWISDEFIKSVELLKPATRN